MFDKAATAFRNGKNLKKAQVRRNSEHSGDFVGAESFCDACSQEASTLAGEAHYNNNMAYSAGRSLEHGTLPFLASLPLRLTDVSSGSNGH